MKIRLLIALTLIVSSLFGCDNDDSRSTITIVVTNDDGIGAPGINTVVNALAAMDDVEVILVAPAANQSGSSDSTSDGVVTYDAGATESGYLGTAVNGTPADSVNVALNDLDLTPTLFVSGVNSGQNVGPFAALSGTVGAARTAARNGYPAVAVSAGLGSNADYDAASALVVDWIEANRDALIDGSATSDIVVSFNVPGCTAGEIRELVSVPLAADFPEGGANPFFTDCSVEPEAPPTDDVDAMLKGFAAVTEVPLEL